MASKNIAYDNKNFKISYEIINPSKKTDIIFLHGWGSNKDIMNSVFKNYFHEFRHIYIDMPGFGKSSNDYILKTIDYANIVKKFLHELNSDFYIIAGHSFGGKVATKISPKNLVLLSTSGILEEKSFSVKLKISIAKFFNILGLKSLTKSFRSSDVSKMSQNMYETFKNVVDEDFSKEFENFNEKAYIFWGEEDSATSLESGKRISSLIKNSQFKSYKGNHYFFSDHAKDIEKTILNGIL